MKLHNHMKISKNVRRCLSVMLVLCIVLSSGSPNMASAADAGTHQHDGSCYEERLVCEKEEHGEECYEERQTLTCNLQESEEHAHDSNCYGTERVLVCELEEHTKDCYEKVLICGKEERGRAGSAAVPVEQSDIAVDLEAETEETAAEDTGMTEPAQDEESAPEADQSPDAGSDVQDTDAGEDVGQDSTEGSVPGPDGDNGTDADADGSTGQDSEENPGTEESSAPAPEDEPEGEEDSSQTPAEGTEGEGDSSQDPDGDCDGEEIPDSEEKPEGDSAQDSEDGSEEEDDEDMSSSEEGSGQPSVFDKDQWKLTCDKEGHDHTADCYEKLFCGLKEHGHNEGCYDKEHNLNCEMEEHEHTDICLLPAEDQQKIEELNELIASLPGMEELADMKAKRDAGEMEEAEYQEKCAAFRKQVEEALEIYHSLEEEMRRYVLGAENLEALAEALEAMDSAEEEPKAFEGEYSDEKVIVRVTAEPGVIPEGAELSVRQVMPQDMGMARMAATGDEEAAAEAEELNEKYEDVQKGLEATVAEDDTKEIAGFLAYDISFLLTDEDGESREVEPQGNVAVSMDFREAYLPEEIADSEGLEIDSVEVVHMKEVEDAETGETTLQAEVLEEAQVSTTEGAELEKAEFVVDSFSIFTISWTTKDGLYNVTLQAVCVDESGMEIPGQKKVGDITITKEDSENSKRGKVHLPAQAPYLPGYSLDRIVLGDPGTQAMGDVHVEEIYFSSNQNRLQRERGTWIDGKWSGDGKYSPWDSKIKKVYFVYKPIVPSRPSVKPEEEKEPAHRKYIKYNEADDDYTLTLDVIGERDIQDIDILLIVDTSYSMMNLGMKEDEEGNESFLPDEQQRFYIVNQALGKLNDSLKKVKKENGAININVGIVTFDGNGYGEREGEGIEGVRDWFYMGTDNVKDAREEVGWAPVSEEKGFDWRLDKSAIAKRKGATNWQAAIRTGEEMLQKSQSSGEKYVIFLTDGDPTVRYAAGSETMTVGSGSATKNLTDKKYGDPYNNNYDAAINEWSMSPGWQSVAGTFVIAVLDESKTDDATNAIRTICGQFSQDIHATMYSGQKADSLGQAFEEIVDNIKYSSFKDVVINDTLSEYVEFAEENPAFTVVHTKLAGPDAATGILLEETVRANGPDKTIATGKYTITYTKKDAAGSGTNSIAFSVLNGADLEDSVKYSISFKVKPTEKAVREYIAAGYPHIGEEDTDAPDNDTSSGKPGFNSNYDERAKVNYTYNDHKPKDADYRHPVVQVVKPGTDDVGITKTMGKVEERNRYPITIQIICGRISGYMLTGSTGHGWTVTDAMAPYTNFLSLAGGEINGHPLTLSDDGSQLMTVLSDGRLFCVAEFWDSGMEMAPELISEMSAGIQIPGDGNSARSGEIKWYLHRELAEVTIDSNGDGYCGYSLTYYVDFRDSGATEIRNTNDTTYIDMGDNKYLYPEKMPFFVNVVGNKKSTVSNEDSMQGALFNVYRDKDRSSLLAEKVMSDQNGHFAFQLGQSDLCEDDLENGSMTVYLEEIAAPDGYERDTALHPITVQISGVGYVTDAAQDKANPGIWDSMFYKDWGSVNAGSIDVSHTSHDGIDPDFLSIHNEDGKLQIAYYNTKPWKIRKISASKPDLPLEGAEFTLYKAADNGGASFMPAYTGTSNAQGYVELWKAADGSEVPSHLLPAGSYELWETKAPSGYALSGEIWLVQISEEGEVSIAVKGGETVDSSGDGSFTFKDEVLYTLPSTGGRGIYWYLIGGTLLMLAAVLISYRNKRNNEGEVLRN